jgi:hypothetical protein
MRLVLRIGPIGLPSVFVAISAAARKPIEAPTLVRTAAARGIQRRALATAPLLDAPRSPPTIPPTNNVVLPPALPTMEPSRPPRPPRKHETRNSRSRCRTNYVRTLIGRWLFCQAERAFHSGESPGLLRCVRASTRRARVRRNKRMATAAPRPPSAVPATTPATEAKRLVVSAPEPTRRTLNMPRAMRCSVVSLRYRPGRCGGRGVAVAIAVGGLRPGGPRRPSASVSGCHSSSGVNPDRFSSSIGRSSCSGER